MMSDSQPRGNLAACIALAVCLPIDIATAQPSPRLDWIRSVPAGVAEIIPGPGGEAVILGTFYGELDLDGDSIPERSSVGGSDIFLARYHAGGVLGESMSFGGTGDDRAILVAQSGGGFYLAGIASAGTDFDSDGQPDVSDSLRAFVASVDADWKFRWVFQHDANLGYNGGAVGANGELVLTGCAFESIDFDEDGSLDVVVPEAHPCEFFVAVFDPGGDLSNVSSFGAADKSLSGRAVAVDSLGFIYSVGTEFEDQRNPSLIVAKFGADLALHWRVSVSGSRRGSSVTGEDVTLGPDGSVYVVGSSGEADFDADGVADVCPGGCSSAFMARYDTSGAFQWVRYVRSSPLSASEGAVVAMDSGGNLYVGGRFYGAADFDGDGVYEAETLVWSPDNFAVFAAKYAADGALNWVVSGWSEWGQSRAKALVLGDEEKRVLLAGEYTRGMDLTGDEQWDVSAPWGNFVASLDQSTVSGVSPAGPSFTPALNVFPNPFTTDVSVSLEQATHEHVALHIYDVLGRRVRTLADEVLLPGIYRWSWDGHGDAGQRVSAGAYFFRLSTQCCAHSRVVIRSR